MQHKPRSGAPLARSEAQFVRHESCPSCGSRDNLARYDDGGGYCFGCGHYEKADGTVSDAPSVRHAAKSGRPLLQGQALDLPKRGLLKATCERFRYQQGHDEQGHGVHIATYCNDAGQPVAQKIRYADKRMSWRGDKASTGLYGAWLWRDSGKQVVITEGEIDALSVAQVFKWPVVSIPDGAGPQAPKAIRKSIDFLSKFEKVVFLFDMDDIGRKAAEECAALLKPGQAYIASLPLKDANDMLTAGRGEELVQSIWNAAPYRPDGVVSAASLTQKALKPIEWGLPWFDADLNNATYGRRLGEVVMIGAGTGVGKTDLILEQISYDLFELGQPVGAVLLEQQPVDTLRRTVGKRESKRFHIPGAYDASVLQTALAQNADVLERLYLYDHFGSTDWATIESRLRYLAVGCGCKLIYLDHLTALAAGEEDERKALETITAQLAGLAKELNVWLCVISHLSTPEGKSHEEGGRVMIRHFKGSRAIGFWSDFMFGLERNQQADDEAERKITVLRCLKDRNTGNATGRTFRFSYDENTGRLSKAPDEAANDNGPSDF